MSKVIFKLTFKHPNFKDTVSKNMAHVDYIATRSGVDKTLTEADLKRELDKDTDNAMSDDETYLKYINERPQSHGLFGQDGIEDPKEVKDELCQHNSFVWRGVVSLREDDAKELGYINKDKWQDLLRNKVPDMAKEMGIAIDNFRWVGAVHMAKGHPHVHIMLWEKHPEKTIGIISKKAIENIRKMYTDEVLKEEKMRLLNEKNAMRDLIRDIAKGDIGEAARLIREVRATGVEIAALISQENKTGAAPVMYPKDEIKLTKRIKHLAEIMPGKGRTSLKLMPENVKAEVKSIADYLLNMDQYKPYMARYLKAVEDNNKLYTGEDEALNNSRENAYNDIIDRVSQVILKAAVESLKDNLFYVDRELANKAVDTIVNLNKPIDVSPERQQVFKRMALSLINTGHTDEETSDMIFNFSKSQNFNFSNESIQELVKNVRNDEVISQELNSLSPTKKIDFYMATLKMVGYSEKDALSQIKESFKNVFKQLEGKLNNLKEKGFLKKERGSYKVTNKGIDELLKVKTLDTVQKEIMKALEEGPGDFESLIDNKNVFDNLHDKDPDEFKIGRFDLKVREEFGDDNQITFKELENNIYKKYTSNDITDIDRAEKEIGILKNRIEKLCSNGYVEFNKKTGIYSFTPEGLEELNNIPGGTEFTRYDANVTFSYIDKAQNGILDEEGLKKILDRDIVNQSAQAYYEKFSDIIEQDQGSKYIDIDNDGNIRATEEGQSLSYELNKLNKFFREAEGNLTEDLLWKICNKLYDIDPKKQFESMLQRIKDQVLKGNIIRNADGSFSIAPFINDIKNFLYQIYKAGGTIHKNNLKSVLEHNIPNRDAIKQFKYLIKRLNNLKKQGCIAGKEGKYYITESGKEKRLSLLHPERNLLRKEINYLIRIGFLKETDKGLKITQKYLKYMHDIAKAKDKGMDRKSQYFDKDIADLIDKTTDNISVGKIGRTHERLLTGKYINNAYQDLKTAYQDLREACNVTDLVTKVLKNLSITLHIAGLSLERIKQILQQWNARSGSRIDPNKINEIVDKTFKDIKENNLWGKITVISRKDWKEMFKALGVDVEPKWMYRGENWSRLLKRGVGMASIIRDIWKSVWNQLERQRMQTEAQAEMMKKSLLKQQARTQSKQAIKEQIIKNKDHSLYEEDELE